MKDLFHLLKLRNVTPNGYYILYSLDQNLSFDLPIPYAAEVFKLKHLGLIDDDSKLTQEGRMFLIETYRIQLKQVKSINDELDSSFRENVETYRLLFPKGVVDGKALRSSMTDLVPAFIWFFKVYPQFTWENVINATKLYLESHQGNYTYCKTAGYFIKKQDKSKNYISLLATWCEAEIDGNDQPSSNIVDDFNKLV